MSVTRDVIVFAKDNGGIVTSHEALALGMSRATLTRRIGDGVFVRIARGVLALPGTATRSDLALRAAHRISDAVVSHESAGLVYRMHPIDAEIPSVTVSHRGSNFLPDVRVHQATDLAENHVQIIEGLPTTTPERTLVDLAKVLSLSRLGRVLDNAVADGTAEIYDVAALFSSLARRGKPGVAKMRSVLEPRVGGPFLTESELEKRLLQLLVEAALPAPVLQFKAPWLLSVNGRVDFAYPDHRVLIEADGRRWHSRNDTFETDRRRDNAAQLAGWRVFRFTWRMLETEPQEVVEIVRLALSTTAER